nr:MAG TPA: hypothetical protein [Caudoviricetes sp.]
MPYFFVHFVLVVLVLIELFVLRCTFVVAHFLPVRYTGRDRRG